MKSAKPLRLLSVVALLILALGWIQPPGLAQQDPAAPAAQPQDAPLQIDSSTNQQLSDAQIDVQTFTGKVVKSGDQLVLENHATKSMYKLDNQDRAKSFEGKAVRVTGTFDPGSGTIRVNNIELNEGS